MRSPLLTGVSAVLLVLCAVRSSHAGPATVPSYPESNEGLQMFMKDILAAAGDRDEARLLAMTESLRLPDPDKWFREVFGDEVGAKLAADYIKSNKNIGPQLAVLFLKMKNPRTLDVSITRVESPDDPKAKAYQQIALAAMKNPVPLYYADITNRRESVVAVWSIVYVNGKFHLAGKMRAVKDVDEPADANNP
ncbi:MAG TPA: hypothetical protein VH518_13460 [Tepidisphaeraceae bacterium]